MFRRIAAKRRSVLTTLAELAGFALIVRGVWLISPTAGWITAGVALILVGALAA